MAEGSDFESKECHRECYSRDDSALASIASPNILSTRAVGFRVKGLKKGN